MGTTQKRLRNLIASCALVASLFQTQAFAFEVYGMRSNMPQEEALQVFRKRFERVQSVQGQVEYNPTFTGILSGTDMIESVTFCRGRLQSYQYDVAGGFRAFTRLVEKETLRRGLGRYEAKANESSVGEWNSIKVYWLEGQDVFEIAYCVIGSEGKDQLYILYKTRSPCR